MPWRLDDEGTAMGHRVLLERGWPEGMPLPNWHVDDDALLSALVGREDISGGRREPDYRWHVSIKHEGRVPYWDEMVDAAHELRPGVCFVVGVPPRSWWMNVHPFVLHLWETKDENLTAQWKAERQAHRPTAARG